MDRKRGVSIQYVGVSQRAPVARLCVAKNDKNASRVQPVSHRHGHVHNVDDVEYLFDSPLQDLGEAKFLQ